MKTSNKILLSVFIAVLLIVTVIHVALTQKYKNGQFTITNSGPKKDSIALQPVKYVRLRSLENVVLVPSDSYRLEVGKNMPSSFRYAVSGDTLVITGDSSTSPGETWDFRKRTDGDVTLHLPEITLIIAQNTSLEIEGRLDTASGAATRIELWGSTLLLGNQLDTGTVGTYFGDVFITAKQGSAVSLTPNKIHFNNLSFELENSSFRDNESGDIKNLMITTDDSSLVQISGHNLKKLK
jgi:hypothetical protein